MWGMIFGGLVCRKAGIPLDVFSAQVPVSLGVLPGYHQYFDDTAPGGNFDNPPASMTTYAVKQLVQIGHQMVELLDQE